jgi:hypothetical protein
MLRVRVCSLAFVLACAPRPRMKEKAVLDGPCMCMGVRTQTWRDDSTHTTSRVDDTTPPSPPPSSNPIPVCRLCPAADEGGGHERAPSLWQVLAARTQPWGGFVGGGSGRERESKGERDSARARARVCGACGIGLGCVHCGRFNKH